MRGRCMCGQVRYQLSGETRYETLCHCDSCRRSAGAPAVAWLTVSRTDFRLLSGELVHYRSSPPVTRSFCAACGTQLLYEHEAHADELDVTIGSLEEANECRPRDHTWCEDRLSWLKLADGLPTYAKKREH